MVVVVIREVQTPPARETPDDQALLNLYGHELVWLVALCWYFAFSTFSRTVKEY
jgi:hypothetical protein